MPVARTARQKDVCPWQRVALVLTIMFGINCTGGENRMAAWMSSFAFETRLLER